MTGAWAASLDQLWHALSPTAWIALAIAAVVVLIALVALLRADKSVANVVLATLAVLAVGVAVALTVRGPVGSRRAPPIEAPQPAQVSAAAMSCLDGLAGDAVEAACERPLFASAESAAAAVSYTAAQMTRLSREMARSSDDKTVAPELSALRRTLEHDRYGLVAHVLAVRDGCTPADCAFFAVLTDHTQIAANMTERAYEGLIGRYALSWNSSASATLAPAAAAAAAPAMIPGVPTGRPMSGDFPSSSSIPPVNIMTTEPGGAATSAAGQGSKPAAAAAPRPTPPAAATAAAAPAAARKPAPKKPPAPAPVPLAPAPPGDDNQQ